MKSHCNYLLDQSKNPKLPYTQHILEPHSDEVYDDDGIRHHRSLHWLSVISTRADMRDIPEHHLDVSKPVCTWLGARYRATRARTTFFLAKAYS